MNRISLAPPLFLLALAACSSEPGTPTPDPLAPDSPAIDTPAPAQTAIPVEPDGGIGDGAGPPGEAAAGLVPVQFRGVWDYSNGTCDPASDMRLDVSGDAMVFYESAGKVTGVRGEDGTTYVDLAMSGEGEQWQTTLGLRLVDAGTGLMVIHPETPDEAERYIRTRCPD